MAYGRDDFVISRDDLFVLRQALFLAVHHLDPTFRDDVHALTGLQAHEFPQMLRQIDSLLDGQESGRDDYFGKLR